MKSEKQMDLMEKFITCGYHINDCLNKQLYNQALFLEEDRKRLINEMKQEYITNEVKIKSKVKTIS